MNIWEFANGHPYAWTIVCLGLVVGTHAVANEMFGALKAWATRCDHPTCDHPCHYVTVEDDEGNDSADSGSPETEKKR